MAIIYTTPIDNTKGLYAYNNNIVRFKSDSTSAPYKSTITINLEVIDLYPNPSGEFYFNLKDYASKIINTKNFSDDIDINLDVTNAQSYTNENSNGFYTDFSLDISVIFQDASEPDGDSIAIHLIAGAIQKQEFNDNQLPIIPNYFYILSKVDNRTNNEAYLKYWKGYPFEISIFNLTNYAAYFGITNISNSNATSAIFKLKNIITSLFVSDGLNDIETFVALQNGINELRFKVAGIDQNCKLKLNKVDARCGVYIKFLNSFGRYNYWLFNDQHFENLTSKYGLELNNNFENIEDSISPTLQSNKISSPSIKVEAKNIDEADNNILKGIFTSLKIYLFIGTPGQVNNNNDWIEVKLKTTSFVLKQPKKQLTTYQLEFELPEINNQIL